MPTPKTEYELGEQPAEGDGVVGPQQEENGGEEAARLGDDGGLGRVGQDLQQVQQGQARQP